jgi:prolyl-tRNA synthetase
MLTEKGFDVLYDDRKASPGYKFADADLIGLPVRITIGKNYFQNGDIEVKQRKDAQTSRVKKDTILETITFLLT